MSKESKEAIRMYNRFSVITHAFVQIGIGNCKHERQQQSLSQLEIEL